MKDLKLIILSVLAILCSALTPAVAETKADEEMTCEEIKAEMAKIFNDGSVEASMRRSDLYSLGMISNCGDIEPATSTEKS